MDEFKLIKTYFQKLTINNPSALNLNDDVFFDKKNKVVISIDTYNEKVHYLNFTHPELLIKKFIRASISDLICKGVKPKYIFISGSGNKKNFNIKNLKLISKSIKEEQKNIILNYLEEIQLILKFLHSLLYHLDILQKLLRETMFLLEMIYM